MEILIFPALLALSYFILAHNDRGGKTEPEVPALQTHAAPKEKPRPAQLSTRTKMQFRFGWRGLKDCPDATIALWACIVGLATGTALLVSKALPELWSLSPAVKSTLAWTSMTCFLIATAGTFSVGLTGGIPEEVLREAERQDQAKMAESQEAQPA